MKLYNPIRLVKTLYKKKYGRPNCGIRGHAGNIINKRKGYLYVEICQDCALKSYNKVLKKLMDEAMDSLDENDTVH